MSEIITKPNSPSFLFLTMSQVIEAQSVTRLELVLQHDRIFLTRLINAH